MTFREQNLDYEFKEERRRSREMEAQEMLEEQEAETEED